MTTQQRRAAVTHLRTAYPVSERRACRLVRLARSRWKYRPRRPSDAPLAAALRAKAAERPRWGYRRLAVLLRREGWVVNLKRVLRVYRAEELRIRKRRRRKQVSTARVPRPISDAPNTQWALDFITDALSTGRRFRVLSVVDEWTRECLALRTDVSLPSWKVVAVLDEVALFRGCPKRLIVDHGPEFVARALDARALDARALDARALDARALDARALDAWAYAHGVELAFTRLAKPVDNCYVESFHDKFRDECLSTHWFLDLADARRTVDAWREDYITVRPHRALGNRTPTEYATLMQINQELESTLTRR